MPTNVWPNPFLPPVVKNEPYPKLRLKLMLVMWTTILLHIASGLPRLFFDHRKISVDMPRLQDQRLHLAHDVL
jgi:hypothetical protein